MINYAHRGASEYAPENTLSSFYLGLMQGANGIETDVQRTKDGVLVLFHDDTVDRVTDGVGKVCELDFAELSALKVSGNAPHVFYDRIVTFREFLEKLSDYDISFAIELKTEGVEEEALALIKEFGALEKTTFTSFEFNCIKRIKELDASARVGYLTWRVEDSVMESLLSIGGEEMAPRVDLITEELMQKWRSAGLGVRAWGVANTDLMKMAVALGVDGMTVNFPDKLKEYISGEQ